MEFHEKLQELRRSRGITQEELAEALYVSRTAISKWESGRGYPSIDSLKAISGFFSVSIDDLLSGEKLLSIAEQENQSNIRRMCGIAFGVVDILSIMLIILPLYPNLVDGYVYSVSLFTYMAGSTLHRMLYWSMFVMLILVGIVKIVIERFGFKKYNKTVTGISIALSIMAVLYLSIRREAYAVTVVFLLFVMKGILLFKRDNNTCILQQNEI